VRVVARAREDAALDDLERRLDAPAFRAAARLRTLWQTRRPRREPTTDHVPTLETVATSEVVPALSWAMSAGAYESAERLLQRVLESPSAWREAGVAGQVLALEALLMLGDRTRARSIADEHADALARDGRGAAVLELVGSPRAPDFLADGRPNLLRLSHRLARGELGALQLAKLAGSRRIWLRTPELHLLFFSALRGTDAPRALRFLNRFLALHDLSPCASLSARGVGKTTLEELRFEQSERPVTGPLVSILMTARDAADTIVYAVESLLNQSYRRIEILVGDDASRDDTLGTLRQRWPGEARLRVFRSARNQGTYNLKSALAQHARGELLTFHDADDLALPDRIERQVHQLRQPGKVACIANFARVKADGSFVFFKDQRTVRLGMVTLMLRRRAFDLVGPFRSAKVGADHELYAALRERFGPDAIGRLRTPVMLALWSAGSATLGTGTESLGDGYRSAARRAYSELVCARFTRRDPAITAAVIDSRLRATGNYVDAAEIVEVAAMNPERSPASGAEG